MKALLLPDLLPGVEEESSASSPEASTTHCSCSFERTWFSLGVQDKERLIHPREDGIGRLGHDGGSEACDGSRQQRDEELRLSLVRQEGKQVEDEVRKVVEHKELHHAEKDLPYQQRLESVEKGAKTTCFC